MREFYVTPRSIAGKIVEMSFKLCLLYFLLEKIGAVNIHIADYSFDKYPEANFLPTASNFTYYAGDLAVIYCSVQHLGSKMVTWRHAEKPTPITIGLSRYIEDTRYSVNYIPETSAWNLMIKNVQMSDAGIYECQVSRDLRKLFILTVIDRPTPPPKSINISGTDYVEKGGKLRLICNATGGETPPEEIDWFKNGDRIVSNVLKETYITKFVSISRKSINSVLEIHRANMTEAGTYTCRTSDLQVNSFRVNVLNAGTFNVKRRTFGKTSGPSYKKHIKGRRNSSGHRVTFNIFYVLSFLLFTELVSHHT